MTEHLSSEAQGLFAVLRQSADPEAVAEIERFVAEASDRELCRVNVIDFAARRRLDEERVIAAFLHAARLGIFELSWNVLCPGCGGVLGSSATLKSVKHEDYVCALCAAGYQPNLDEMVEVTFTLSRRVRKIAAHEPDDLPFFEYMRQIFWASGMNIPEDLERIGQEITLDTLELPAGEKAQLSLQLPAGFLIVFEPVTHAAQVIDLKGSTGLYQRVGDIVAFDMVRAHFRVLNEIVAAEAGAVVKTIGDAVMATFPTPDRAVSAALRIREAMGALNAERGSEDLLLKMGIHEGPCLAVVLNDRQDYFGQTVNIASRVQGLAASRAIYATGPVVDHPQTANLLAASGVRPVAQQRELRGIPEAVPVYEIP